MKDLNVVIKAIIDQYKSPILFVDNDHIIRYGNNAALERYSKRGYPNIVDESLFDCHNMISKQKIIEYHQRLKDGEDEIFLKINKHNIKITIVAVRGEDKTLLGYYERFEDLNQ